MKLLGALLALVLAVSASQINVPRSEWLEGFVPDRTIESFSFKPNREYKFFYNGQLATGIPGSSHQHSATRIQALVSLVFKTETECVLKVREVRFGKLSDEMTRPRDIMPFSMFETVAVEPELYERLMKPIKFEYKHGMISEVVFDGEEQPWSANIKRGILNTIQINLNKEQLVHEVPERLRYDVDVKDNIESFKTIEKTIEGECETLYTVVSNPCRHASLCRSVDKPVVNITKSINFEKCQRRPEIRYNERFEQLCPSCEPRFRREERTFRASTVQRVNAVCEHHDRKNCLIEQATVESQYNLAVLNEEANMITTYVNQTIELVCECEPQLENIELRSPKRSDSDMIYTLDWDIVKEEFFLEGREEFQQQTPFSPLEDKIEFVKSILQKMVMYMREKVDEEAPRQFTRLVKVLRMLKRDELERCHELFFKQTPEGFTHEEHKKIKDVLPDAMALCGTHDCVHHLVHMIKTDAIKPLKASFVIRKLMDIRVVSKNTIQKVMSICESSEKCERHAALKQAVYLSAGSMMRAMCTEQTRDKLAVEFKKPEPFCTEEIKEEFVRLLTSKLFESEKLYDQVLCMKALSNAGIDVSIKLLEKVIRNVDRKYPTVVRVEAMLATRNLIDQIPNKIVKILLPIYMNRDECAQCRNTAVYMVLQCAPEKYIVDQIAHQVKVERHRQVSAFTFTLLESMANSTEPCEKRLADDIKLSLRHARYVPLNSWLFNSKYIRVVEKYHKSINKGYSLDMAAIYSNHSIVPHTWAATLNMIGYGQYTPNFFTIGMRQEGLGKIVNALLRQHTHKLQSSLSDLLSGKFELPSPRFNYRQELKDLFNKLNVEERNVEDDQTPFGSIFMKFRNQEYGFIPLSSEMLPEELIELLGSETTNINELVKRAERLLKDVTLPFNVHTATFMSETSRKIPTTIGLPLTASMKMPTMMQASGVLKIEVDETDPLKKVKIIMTDVKPSIVMTKIAKMESWSPIMNTGVKIVATAKVFTPFEAAVEIDRTVEPTEFKLTVKPLLNAREEIVAVQCRPICFTLVWPKQLRQWQEPEEKTIYGSEWTRVMKHDREFGEYALGMKLRSRGFWHYLPQKHQPNTPIACFAGNNKYSLTAEPGYEMPKEFVIRVTGNVFKTFDNKNVNVNFEKFFEENTENFLSKDSSEENIDETIKSAHYKTYKGERPVNNEIEIELSTKGSSIKRECKVNANCLCDEQVKSCKCKLAVERTPVPMKETKPWKLNSELEILYPKTPYTISELTSEKQLLTKFTCKWGDEKEITIKMIGEQSRRMQELKNRSQYKRLHDNQQHRENFRSLFSPVAQYTPTLKYSLLDEIKIDIDYKLEKVEKQLMSRVYSWVKQQYFWQTNTSDVEIRNPEDRLRVKLNLDPLNRRYLNVTVWSPREQTKIEDIPLPIAVTSLNMRRLSTPSQSWYQMVSNAVSGSRPVCEIRTDSIRTFDEIRYDIPTSTCYSVLAKDCRSAELSKFAVLIKKQTVNSEKKTLKIVTENVKLVVRATEQESLICELNGEEKPCEEVREVREHGEHTVLRCSLTPRSIYMRCELPEAGISVYFDGLSANIKVSPMYRRQVCGLCSQYEEEQFITSKLERVSEKSKLFESFLVKEDSECEHEINEKKSLRTFEIFDDEYNTESLKPIIREEQEIEPIERTDVIEQAQELCFSKQPVKKCPRGSHPIEFQTKEKIVYTCMSKNELQAEIFERRVRIEKEVLRSEIENLPSSFTEARKIPSKCRFY